MGPSGRTNGLPTVKNRGLVDWGLPVRRRTASFVAPTVRPMGWLRHQFRGRFMRVKKDVVRWALLLGTALLLARPAVAQVSTLTATAHPVPAPPAAAPTAAPAADSVALDEMEEMEEDSVAEEAPALATAVAPAAAQPAAAAAPVAPAAPVGSATPVAAAPSATPVALGDSAAPAAPVALGASATPAAPLVPLVTAAPELADGRLQSLSNSLQLNEFQSLALRRALADPSAEGTARQRLQAALTPGQQARLLAWEAAHPAAPRLTLPVPQP